MGHYKKHSKKRSTRSALNVLPMMNRGLTKIGSTAEDNIPFLKRGVSTVYGTMSSGLDLGVKGARNIRRLTKRVTGLKSASLAGGRRTKRRRGSRRR